MRAALSNARVAWLVAVLLAAVGVACFWPHEPAYSSTADRDDQFLIITGPVGAAAAGINDPIEGVFILDFLTGQLNGAVLNRQTGKYAPRYQRNLARDFGVDPAARPHYAVASGYSQLPNQGGVPMASGVLHIAELSSGRVIAYAFPWVEAPRGPVMSDMMMLDGFQWRPPQQK